MALFAALTTAPALVHGFCSTPREFDVLPHSCCPCSHIHLSSWARASTASRTTTCLGRAASPLTACTTPALRRWWRASSRATTQLCSPTVRPAPARRTQVRVDGALYVWCSCWAVKAGARLLPHMLAPVMSSRGCWFPGSPSLPCSGQRLPPRRHDSRRHPARHAGGPSAHGRCLVR